MKGESAEGQAVDEIVSTPRTVILDQAARQKIDGYVKLWKRRYNDEWPPSAPVQGTDGNWYGTTQGDFNNYGTLYKLT